MRLIFFSFLFFLCQFCKAQELTSLDNYDQHLKQAIEYNNVSLFAECIEEINILLRIAKEEGWLEKELSASIFLAEIKRKTVDYDEGLSILRSLDHSTSYPELNVRKLGRMAALFNQKAGIIKNSEYLEDSVLIYLNKAIRSAISLNLKAEQASLYNELGYTLGKVNVDSSIFYLEKSAELYANILDTQNYLGVKVNILRIYAQQKNKIEAEKIISEILNMSSHKVEGGVNLSLDFYGTLTFYYKSIGDSVQFNKWNTLKYKKEIEHLKNVGSSRLNSYRALYETQKYQDEAEKKAAELSAETAQKKRLAIYLVILASLVLGIALLLFKERKLKKKVNRLNKKYHMLIVESNHRIKNNLQMIISMLQYANKDLKGKDSLSFKRMSGKIQTISALHKHLYLDVHNELVDLNTYFKEILRLYEELSNDQFEIETTIKNVKIESERIVYFGLIFNEMLTNTIEHNNATEKKIKVEVKDLNGRFCFIYTDGSCFKVDNQKGTGLMLIEQLVKRVEGSRFQVDGSIGKYQFEFYV